MKIPVKVLYASYLPKVKDRDKILMADSGANVGGNPPIKNLLTSLPTGYLDNLDAIGQGASNGTPYPNRTPQPNNPFGQFDARNPQGYNGPINPYRSSDTGQVQPDTSNYQPSGTVQGFSQGISDENYVNPIVQPKHPQYESYNGQVGQAILTGAAAFDAVLPYDHIKRWPRVQPQLSPNQHPNGTGSQALMEYGGKMPNGGTTRGLVPAPTYNMYNPTRPLTKDDSSSYLNNFNSLVNREPWAVKRAADYNQFGVPTVNPNGGSTDRNTYFENVNTANAYDDAEGKNLMTDTQVHEELYRPFAKPKDVKGKMKSGGWIQKAINPDHKGYCTPMTKATCTPHRKAFAMRAKHHNLADGGQLDYPVDINNPRHSTAYDPNLANNDIKFQSWFSKNTPEGKSGQLYSDKGDYDYYSFYRNGGGRSNTEGHFPDTFKRTNHQTFSNESIYSTPEHIGGSWKGEKYTPQKKMKNGGPVGDGPVSYPADHLGSNLVKGKWKNTNFKSGGSLSPSKAAEILHDGTAQGHPLTPKQRRFMGWKSHQKAPGGVTVPGTAQSAMQQANPTGEQFTPHDRGDAYMVDALNETLITGKMAKNTGYTPDQQAIMKDAYMWRQVNGQRNNGQQNIEQYFNRPVNPSSPTDYYRGKLGHIGGGAVSMYNSTPSLDVQNAQSPNSVASMKQGGLIYDNGGPIQTHWGGDAEPIAYNPYDGGTTQFNGDSHAEGGIGMSYNGKKVEVEGGETAAKDSEGNLNVFGNMYVPGTKTKFKTASKEIAEKEEKFDKLKTNGTAVVNALEPKNKYDQIKFNAGQLMMEGGDMGQKALAKKKQQLADLQNAMLDTAKAHNIDPQGMSQGNIKKAKKGMWMKAPDGVKVIKEGDEPVKDWAYYQKLIEANTDAVKKGNMNDATYTDLLQATNDARLAQSSLKGPGPQGTLNINEPTRSDRNNNPGNIKYGLFAKSIDPNVKRDKDGFAIFSDPTAGHSAMYSLLTGNKYKNLSIKDAITKWTGGKPYSLSGLGDLQGKKVSDLKPDELSNVLDYMQKGEGTSYGIPKTTLPPLAGSPSPTQPAIPGFGLPTAPPFTPAGPPPTVTQPSVPIRGIPNQPETRPRPTQAKPLGFGDLASDIFAIAQNQERPVYAQKYEPQLYQPYQVSFQDRLNDNNQSFNNVERLIGSTNPTALGSLAGQKYSADNSVRAEEFRTNQGISNQVYNENIALTNDAQLKNLGIADTQFTRQDLAGSKTREMNQLIANDISNKYSQVQMRNNTLRAYENLYNFRLQPNEQGGLTETNYNDPQNFDFSGQNGRGEGAGPSQRKITNYDRNGNVKNYRTVQNSELTDENQQQLLEERRRKNDEDMLKLFHGGNVRKRYKPIRL